MNERDSESLAATMIKRGHEITTIEKEADVLLFNTCSVREQAERKAAGKVGYMKKLKREKPNIIIGILGCMAQRKGEELMKELPHVDFVLGTDQLGSLPNIIEELAEKREKIIMTDANMENLDGMDDHISSNKISEFISVMRGCDMFCSYCIVPYVRGREKSRPISDIVKEARKLAQNGIKEITLLGQNVSAYGLNQSTNERPIDSPFSDLIQELHQIDEIKRIRFISPHPYFFNDKLINTIAELPKVCNNIHLPLQSGSDTILKKMNRRYNTSIYMDVVNKLKVLIPDVTFSTDIIVAFPGETEEDFNATRNIMNEVGFDNAYIFKYSPREGTPSAKLQDNISMEIKEERNKLLLSDLAKRTESHNAALIGTVQEILVEGISKRNSSRWTGRTEHYKVAVFEHNGMLKPGDFVNLKITNSSSMTLYGEI